MRFHRRGQSSGSVAGIVILLTLLGLILFYVIGVPESERVALNITQEKQQTLLDVQPGLVGKESGEVETFTYFLPTVTVDNTPQAHTFLLKSQVNLQSNLLFRDKETVSFTLDDLSDLSYAKIGLMISEKQGSGNLILYLNGEEFYSSEIEAEHPLLARIPFELLVSGKNNLTISVSRPGWRFWEKNSYLLTNVNLILGKYDSPTAKVTQLVILRKEDIQDIQQALMSAYVKQTGDRVNLNLSINDEPLFSGIPVSDFELDIPTSLLTIGNNHFTWEVARDGRYEILFGKLVISKEEPGAAKQYSFTLSNKTDLIVPGAKCSIFLEGNNTGDAVTIELNGKTLQGTFGDDNTLLIENICENLQEGKNTVILSAPEETYVKQLKIVVTT